MKKIKKIKRFDANQKIEPVSRYVSEGNPNTDKVIEQTRKKIENKIQAEENQ